jgi:hypothetical protein
MPSRNRASTMRALAARRSHLPCRVVGCNRPRNPKRAASYCAVHGEARRLYGHELGRRVYRKQYDRERKEVAALFAAFPDHPGVRNASEWLGQVIARAGRGDKSVPAYVALARLHRHDVSPLAALVELCAVYVFAWRNPAALPTDQRLTYGLAVALFRMAPKDAVRTRVYGRTVSHSYRDEGSRDREAVGTLLRTQLAPLFANVASALQEQEQHARDVRASMAHPFSGA